MYRSIGGCLGYTKLVSVAMVTRSWSSDCISEIPAVLSAWPAMLSSVRPYAVVASNVEVRRRGLLQSLIFFLGLVFLDLEPDCLHFCRPTRRFWPIPTAPFHTPSCNGTRRIVNAQILWMTVQNVLYAWSFALSFSIFRQFFLVAGPKIWNLLPWPHVLCHSLSNLEEDCNLIFFTWF